MSSYSKPAPSRLLVSAALISSAALGCAGATTAGKYPDIDTSVQDQETHPDFARALYDEAQDLSRFEFRSEDGALNGQILGRSAPTVSRTETGYELVAEVGGAAPVSCFVEEGVVGLGGFARGLIREYLFSYAAHELKYVFTGAQQGIPLVVVHGQYLEPSNFKKNRETGFFKTVVAGQKELVIACQHDQFGYRQTLERVALSLAESVELDRGGKPLLPLVREDVYQIIKAGAAIGVRERVIRADDEDFRQTWVRTTWVSLNGKQALGVRDVIETIESDPDGMVTAASYRMRQDGKLQTELELSETPLPGYSVTGRKGSSPVQGRFTVENGLLDPLAEARARVSGEGYDVYRPELEAAKPTRCRFSRGPTGALQQREGSRRILEGQPAKDGHWQTITRSDGLVFERVPREVAASATPSPDA